MTNTLRNINILTPSIPHTDRTPILKDAFIFLLIIFSLNFFSAAFAHAGILKSLSFAYLLGAIFISIPFFFRRSTGFILPVKMISVSILFSVLMAYISWKQELSYSVSIVPYLVWFVFFFLLYLKYQIHRVENMILFYAVIYILLYFFQFTHSGVVYFGYRDEFVEDRGIIRIDFPGGGVFFLAYFISLIRISQKRKYRWFYLLFILTGVIVTVLQVTRQSIALVIIITLYHFLKKASWVKKISVLVIASAAILLFFFSDNPVSRGLIEKQKETSSEGDQYIRVLASDYFLNHFSPNTLSKIFGNGYANNTSEYGKYIINLGDMYGYFLTDLGLIGFYVMFGIFPIIGYIIIFIRSFTTRVPEKYYYLKYYMVFIFFTCLTSDYAYSINYLFTNVFVLYCFQLIFEKQRSQKLMRLSYQ